MTSQPTPRVTEILAAAGDCSGEMRAGSTFASLFAMIARRHMHRVRHHARAPGRGRRQEPCQRRAESRRAHAQDHHHRAGAERQADRRAAHLYDCSLDQRRRGGRDSGAARARRRIHRQAGARAGDRAGLRLSWRSIRKRTSPRFRRCGARREKAYKMAGVAPGDIQFAELHDCFTIAEIIATRRSGIRASAAGRSVRGRRLHGARTARGR